ncbi:MAG: hypothetical protein P8K08_13520 [Fuerstiella sp.]|nr:hypothetical protein [Fuerstiella sp.]
MAPEMARKLKALQQEKTPLKTLMADQTLAHAILKAAAQGNFQTPSEVTAQWTRYVSVLNTTTFGTFGRECSPLGL